MSTKLESIAINLSKRGYTVTFFQNKAEAASYLNREIDGRTVGIGGSLTVETLDVFEMLRAHNQVFWHWKQEADTAREAAMKTDIYLTSVNAAAATGELVSIDGVGNRIASMLYGHKKVYFIIGRNKVTDTYEEAIWRARNVAAPRRARQLGRKTPCAVNADKCYDCQCRDRICKGMVTLWGSMSGVDGEVLLINEDLGL